MATTTTTIPAVIDTAGGITIKEKKPQLESLPSETCVRPTPPSVQDAATGAAVAPDPQIHTLRLHEYKAAALTLAHAFDNDPCIFYPIDTPDNSHLPASDRWSLHLSCLEYTVYAHILKGLVTSIGPPSQPYSCVAMWCPPGTTADDLWTILRSGMWRLFWKFSPQGRHRFFNDFLPLMHRTKLDVLGKRDPEAWYLVYIGTLEEARGKGYARRLIQHVTDIADSQSRPIYLESSNSVNVNIYTRFGFQVVRKLYLGKGKVNAKGEEEEDPGRGCGIELDIMVREPSSHRSCRG